VTTCPDCARVNRDEADRCDCGHVFNERAERPFFSAAASPDGPRGVAGWLLLLCVLLTILAPLSMAALAFVNLRTPWDRLQAPIRVLVATETLGLLLVGAFACYAGSRLWALDPGGPRLARWALAAHPLFRLLLIPVAFFLPVDRNLASKLFELAGTEFFRSVPSAVIWIVYLNVSKRVAATYDEP
jgi:hypothetical protein